MKKAVKAAEKQLSWWLQARRVNPAALVREALGLPPLPPVDENEDEEDEEEA